MKEFMINYKGMHLSEIFTVIVKAKSAKEAIIKFHNERINSDEMIDDFMDNINGAIENKYFKHLCDGIEKEFDWDSHLEDFLRSNKGFKNKRKFKDLDLDSFIKECLAFANNEVEELSLDAKEAIYKYLYESVEALNIKKFRVIE